MFGNNPLKQTNFDKINELEKLGYVDLGWQLNKENNLIIKEITEKKLPVIELDLSTYLNRGTNIVYICQDKKVFWHIDMSD